MHSRTPLAGFLALFLYLLPLACTAQELPQFADLADKAGPAVVNISTESDVEDPGGLGEMFRFRQPGSPFEDFFRQFEKFFKMPDDESPKSRPPHKERSLGSGFIISDDGYIVTNNHVVDADVIKVNLQGHNKESESFTATVVGRDTETDLALLKIETDMKLPVLEFGDSDAIRVGEWVMAIGNPFGLDHTVTAGIISAKSRNIGSGPFDDFIQTDASINPGNSGGPLLNLDGKVVGINTAIVASGQGIGFAIPSNMAKRVIAQLRENKKVSRGWIGVTIQDVDENTAKALGMDKPAGALISSVLKGHPAEKAGVRTGDVILEIDGQEVADSNDLLRKIAALKPGDTTELAVWRKGRRMSLDVTLGERDIEALAESQQEEEPEVESAPAKTKALGMSLRPVQENEAAALGLDKARGLLVTELDPTGAAVQNDLRVGDVIQEANQEPVNSVADFDKLVERAAKDKGVVMLLIKRGKQNLFRTIPLE